jgi:hypothetical protein
MKILFILFALCLIACNENDTQTHIMKEDTVQQRTRDIAPEIQDTVAKEPEPKEVKETKQPLQTFSNTRFKEVTVEKTGNGKYTVQGKAQIFEASFGWVVEDGHNELKQGNVMTDAGAPEWGNFKFSIDVKKARENSTLTLILFESSAKDGSRQYTLPIALK